MFHAPINQNKGGGKKGPGPSRPLIFPLAQNLGVTSYTLQILSSTYGVQKLTALKTSLQNLNVFFLKKSLDPKRLLSFFFFFLLNFKIHLFFISICLILITILVSCF